MASNINPTNIDGAFPVAGQDNNSQGFRDNFTNIRQSLTFARNEIEELQQKAVLKEALASSLLHNDMDGMQLIRPELVGSTEKLIDYGVVSGNVTLSVSNGAVFKITTNGNITIELSDWPTGATHIKSRVIINVTSTSHTVILPGAITNGTNEIAGLVGSLLTFPAIGEYVFEFASNDGGISILIIEITKKLTNARNTRLPPASSIGITGDRIGMMASDNTHLYYCYGNFNGTSDIWGRVALNTAPF